MAFEGLSPKQKWGMALAFIPVVSTVVGIIQAIVYFRSKEKHHADVAVERQNMHEGAKTVDQIAVAKFKERALIKLEGQEEEIIGVSIVEMIPFVNIFAAFLGLPVMSRISTNQDSIDNPSDAKILAHLRKRYFVDGFANDQSKQDRLDGTLKIIYAKLDSNIGLTYQTVDKRWLQHILPDLAGQCRKMIEGGDTRSGDQILKEVLEQTIQQRILDAQFMEKKVSREQEAMQQVQQDNQLMIALGYPTPKLEPAGLENSLHIYKDTTAILQKQADSITSN